VNGRQDILWEDEEEVESVGSGSDDAGNGDSERGEVGNDDSEVLKLGIVEKRQIGDTG
jgi:hypothetical protein